MEILSKDSNLQLKYMTKNGGGNSADDSQTAVRSDELRLETIVVKTSSLMDSLTVKVVVVKLMTTS